MKLKNPLPWIVLGLVVAVCPAFAEGEVGPTPIHISWDNPNPPAQQGLLRPVGDGNNWTFQIILDEDDANDISFSQGPTWSYPGNGTDPSWGMFHAGQPGDLTLDWVSPDDSGGFTVTVSGKLHKGPVGGVGGGAGDDNDEAFTASWDGQVAGATILVRRSGSTDAFGSSATVAAGNIANTAHQADVQVTVLDSNGNPLAGVAVPTIDIQSGGLGPSSTVTAYVAMNSTITDPNGQVTGTFTSGNRTQDTVIQVDLNKGTSNPSATVTQVWNQLSDGSNGSANQTWSYDIDNLGIEESSFDFDYDIASTASYKMQYNDGSTGVPITGHGMTMTNTLIKAYEWNPNAGPDCDGVPMGDYVYNTFSPADTGTDAAGNTNPWSALNGLCTWIGVSEAPPGTYNDQITVASDNTDTYWVDDVTFTIVDGNAYGPNGPN